MSQDGCTAAQTAPSAQLSALITIASPQPKKFLRQQNWSGSDERRCGVRSLDGRRANRADSPTQNDLSRAKTLWESDIL